MLVHVTYPLSVNILRITLFMLSSNQSEITLQVPPFPSVYFRQTGIVECLAFSNSALTRWWSTTPQDAIINSIGDIPSFRMYKTIRDHAHRELKPGILVVCALIDDQVVGAASWGLPKKLWRSETLAEFIYRKAIEYMDDLEDCLFPSWWNNLPKREEFNRLQQGSLEKYLGSAIDETWYLKVLCVHPGFQRKGIGAKLLDWGLKHARERGEKVYVEASDIGKGLYIKKGFKELGEIVLGDGEVVIPCMIWDPATAPSQDEIAEQPGPIQI